jgi:hypothetical protein
VEIRDLLDPRKCSELSNVDLALRLHVTADAQHEMIRNDRADADVGAEPRELIDGTLTRWKRGHAATIRLAAKR